MSSNELDNWFLQQEEPLKECLLALRSIILQQGDHITMGLSYGMPTFYFKGKRFCYLWVHKTLHQPYIGIIDGNKIEHPELLQEKRSRMKILLIDMEKDFPMKSIKKILKQAIDLLS